MPRPGWRKPESDRRLSDAVSVGVLTKVFSPQVVDEVIAACGRTERRRRSLPARVVAYFAMGMALHADGSDEDVLALISDGLGWAEREEHPVRLANKAAISHARGRVGPEPMAELFPRVAGPLPPRRPRGVSSRAGDSSRSTAPAWTWPTLPATMSTSAGPES